MSRNAEYEFTSHEFTYAVESQTLDYLPKHKEQTAGNFSVELPKYNRITKKHDVWLDTCSITAGFYNLTHYQDIMWFITEDHKKYDLIGHSELPPRFIDDIDKLLQLVNNRIRSIFSGEFQKRFHGISEEIIPYFADDGNGKKKLFKPVFQHNGKIYYSHIYMSQPLAKMTGYKAINVDDQYYKYNPDDEDDYIDKPPNAVKKILQFKPHYDKVILKCNFTDKPLWVQDFVNMPSLTLKGHYNIVEVTKEDIDKLHFWFENEFGEKLKNTTGITYLQLHFKRMRL